MAGEDDPVTGPIVIEPGTEAWAALAQAVRTGRKLSIDDRGPGRLAVKVGEGMWSATLSTAPTVQVAPPRWVDRHLTEPPANG